MCSWWLLNLHWQCRFRSQQANYCDLLIAFELPACNLPIFLQCIQQSICFWTFSQRSFNYSSVQTTVNLLPSCLQSHVHCLVGCWAWWLPKNGTHIWSHVHVWTEGSTLCSCQPEAPTVREPDIKASWPYFCINSCCLYQCVLYISNTPWTKASLRSMSVGLGCLSCSGKSFQKLMTPSSLTSWREDYSCHDWSVRISAEYCCDMHDHISCLIVINFAYASACCCCRSCVIRNESLDHNGVCLSISSHHDNGQNSSTMASVMVSH